MEAKVITVSPSSHKIVLTGGVGLNEDIRLDYNFALERDARRFCEMINKAIEYDNEKILKNEQTRRN